MKARKRPEYLPDGSRMIRMDVSKLDPRYALPATGWNRLAVTTVACISIIVAVLLIEWVTR